MILTPMEQRAIWVALEGLAAVCTREMVKASLADLPQGVSNAATEALKVEAAMAITLANIFRTAKSIKLTVQQ